MPQVAIAVAGLALSAYSTIRSGKAADKQASAQRKAMKSQQAAEDVKQARERRQAIREARIKRAAIVQSGANQGATSSSAVSGGAGSITSQLSGTLSFLDTVGAHNRTATGYNLKASSYGASAQKWAGMASLGATIFDAAGGTGTIFEGVSTARTKFDINQSIKNNPDIY